MSLRYSLYSTTIYTFFAEKIVGYLVFDVRVFLTWATLIWKGRLSSRKQRRKYNLSETPKGYKKSLNWPLWFCTVGAPMKIGSCPDVSHAFLAKERKGASACFSRGCQKRWYSGQGVPNIEKRAGKRAANTDGYRAEGVHSEGRALWRWLKSQNTGYHFSQKRKKYKKWYNILC